MNIFRTVIILSTLLLTLNSYAQTSLTAGVSTEISPEGANASVTEISLSRDLESGNTFYLDLGHEQSNTYSGYADTTIAYTFNFGSLSNNGLALGGGLVLPTGDYKQGLGGRALGVQARNALAYGISLNSFMVVDLAYTMFVNYHSPEGIKYNRYEFRISHKYNYLVSKKLSYNLSSETNWTDNLIVTDPNDPTTARVQTSVSWTLGVGAQFECKKTDEVTTNIGFDYYLGVAPSAGVRGGSFFVNWLF